MKIKRRRFLATLTLGLLGGSTARAAPSDADRHYRQAEAEGHRLEEQLRAQHQARLMAMTGGKPFELWLAERQLEAERLLGEIVVTINAPAVDAGGSTGNRAVIIERGIDAEAIVSAVQRDAAAIRRVLSS